MKLMVVSEFFYPYKTSTQKIMTELCEDFVEYGAEVRVLTTKNAYREKKQILKSRELYKDIYIKRVFSSQFNRDNKIGRIINYFTFIVSVFLNLLFSNSYDKVLFVSNPPIVPYIGYLIKKIKKIDYIYLVHDVYPDVAEKLGIIKKDGFISKVMNSINNKIYEYAEKVIVLGNDMKDIIISKGVNPLKIEIVTNWADSSKNYEKEISYNFKKKYNLDGKFNILYTGNISKVHAIDTILEVAKKLNDRYDILFTIIGDGNNKDYVRETIKKYNLKNIQLKDYIYGEEYNNILNCADMFIVTLQEGIEGLGVPSKTYSYMSVYKPIIAIMNEDSEIGSMVNKNNLGKQFNKNEVDEIVKYIYEINNNPVEYKKISERIRRLFNEKYERKIVTKKFFDLII